VWQSADDVSQNGQIERRFEPTMPPHAAAARLDAWRDAVARVRSTH
jgi:glycerol kinase